MKRSDEALVMTGMLTTIVAMAIAGMWGRAGAQPAPVPAPVVKLQGSASLTGASAAKFHVVARFSTDPPGAQLFTIQKAVIFFPDHSGTNGQFFKSCSAKQIERFHGAIRRCPKGSKIGSGTVTARALQLGITAHGRVNLFNSRRGKSIAFNIQTLHPAVINETIDAPITQLHGKYGEKLTLVVPHPLQEIIPGSFVGVQTFDVTISGAAVVHGVEYSFLKARTCPKRALHGIFEFENWATGQTATVTADTKVHCTHAG
jgi:hypothetical protein